jgi:outer membrane lipoprotein-sorting protein
VSVATASARRRWAAVAATCAVLLGLPLGASRALDLLARSDDNTSTARAILERALGSRAVPYTGLGESRGTLGLPSLPGLGAVAGLLGGTTRTRVWWAAPDRWRVDVLTVTGEQGTYGTASGVVAWDYERRRLRTVVGEPPARLPRADDLLAPQAARRLLSGVGRADTVERLPDRRVAGRTATGLRVVPSARSSTIGAAEVWVDAESGLPLRLRVVDRAGTDALVTQLSDVRLGRPAAAVTTPPYPAGVADEVVTAPDLAAAVDQRAPWRLPDTLAGLPVTRSLLEGSATYGRGLVRFTVLPLPDRIADDVVSNARSAGAATLEVDRGEAWRVSPSLLDVVVAQGDDLLHTYLIAGLVTPDVLTEAARELLADPPPRRDL